MGKSRFVACTNVLKAEIKRFSIIPDAVLLLEKFQVPKSVESLSRLWHIEKNKSLKLYKIGRLYIVVLRHELYIIIVCVQIPCTEL